MPQALAPPRVNADNCGLIFPSNAVNPIFGKNSAMDSPTCALAERRSCSVSRTSGRRSNKAEGNPAGTSGGSPANNPPARWIGPGTRPNKMQSSFSVVEIWLQYGRRCGGRVGQGGFGARRFQVRCRAAFQTLCEDFQTLGKRIGGAPGDFQFLIQLQQLQDNPWPLHSADSTGRRGALPPRPETGRGRTH